MTDAHCQKCIVLIPRQLFTDRLYEFIAYCYNAAIFSHIFNILNNFLFGISPKQVNPYYLNNATKCHVLK